MTPTEQARRKAFEDAAREAECDDAAFERVFAAIVPAKRPERKPDAPKKPRAKGKPQ